MDTRLSLGMLPEAMQTLSLVASTYDTETMKKAYSAACLLVRIHQQRREADIAVFGEAISMQQPERAIAAPRQLNPGLEDYSWLEALVADLPGLQRDDLDQFLNADVINGSSLLGGFEPSLPLP